MNLEILYFGIIAFIIAKTIERKIVNHNNEFERFKEYCEAIYAHIPQRKEYTLEKVIVIHRHGDRAPIKIKNSSWIEYDCVGCEVNGNTIEKCKTRECKEGDLTEKGFEQMEKLGNFIKNEYLEKLYGSKKVSIENISLRATEIGRTHASLAGVVQGLFKIHSIHNVKIPMLNEDSLVNPKTCPALGKFMSESIDNYYVTIDNSENLKKKFSSQFIADSYMTHICNPVPINCNELNCDPSIIKKYLDASLLTWKAQTEQSLYNINVLKMLFGRFANEFLDILKNDKKMHIFSAHDGSLSLILSGLGTLVIDHPPYASVIFLEIWRYNDKEYLRIIFNKNVCESFIDDSTNISMIKLQKYLNKIKLEGNNGFDVSCDAFQQNINDRSL